MKRRIIFATILAFAIAVDMISTQFMVDSGYRELTGLMVLMISVSKYLLYLWVILWGCLIYLLYPLFEKFDLRIHIETIAIWFAITSLLAGIGNVYLYLR